MKFFGHESNARNDQRLRKITIKHGMEGIGVYWSCNEMIAEKIEAKNTECILDLDLVVSSHDLNIDQEKLKEILESFVEIGLYTKIGENYCNTKILKRIDDYTKRKLRILSVHNTDKVPVKEKEKKEKEKKEKEKKEKEFKHSLPSVVVVGFKEFNVWWTSEFLKRFKSKYDFVGGRDGKAVSTMLGNHSLEELKKFANAGWNSKSGFIRENCSTIYGFASMIPRIATSSISPTNEPDYSKYDEGPGGLDA